MTLGLLLVGLVLLAACLAALRRWRWQRSFEQAIRLTDKRYCELLDLQRRQDHER